MKRIYDCIFLLFILFSVSCKNENAKAKDADSSIRVSSDKILDSLFKTVNANPSNPEYRQYVFDYLISKKDFAKAKAQNDSIYKYAGEVPVYYVNEATLFDASGDTIQAIIALKKAIQLNPYYTQASLMLAELYCETKNPLCTSFIDSCFLQQRANGIELDLMLIKGNYFAATNREAKAILIYDQCIADDYRFMDAYQEKAYVLYKQKKYKEALEVLDKAVTVNNKYADGYFWMAKNNEALKDTIEAINNYQRAVFFDKNFTEARDALKRLGFSVK